MITIITHRCSETAYSVAAGASAAVVVAGNSNVFCVIPINRIIVIMRRSGASILCAYIHKTIWTCRVRGAVGNAKNARNSARMPQTNNKLYRIVIVICV